jgi:hypothetical protein
MKCIFTIVLLVAVFASYGQEGLSGTFVMENGPPANYVFMEDSLFSFYREDCQGVYYGQGKYSISNDSLLLSFERNESNKTTVEFTQTGLNGSVPKLSLKVFRKEHKRDKFKIVTNLWSIGLLDSNKVLLNGFHIKVKKKCYEVSDLSLTRVKYIQLVFNDFGVKETIELDKTIAKHVQLNVFTTDYFNNQIISDQIRNEGKITMVSAKGFMLNRWGYDVKFIRKK